MKKVLIIGASGVVGQHLIQWGLAHKWRITTFSYTSTPTPSAIQQIPWNPSTILNSETLSPEHVAAMDHADIIINLAGSTIAEGRLGPKVRTKVRQSRQQSTAALVKLLNANKDTTKTWIQMSAIGYYGSQGEAILDESATKGELFLSEVCNDWEEAVKPIEHKVSQLAIMRLGLVLAKEAPAWKRLIQPIQWGIGSALGSGQQYWPWIHIDDVCGAIDFIINNPTLSGVFNLSAPEPVTQRTFTKVLANVISRPVFLPAVPSWALRLVLGRMVDELILPSQRAIPKRLLDHQYRFTFDTLEPAIRHITGK